MQPLRTVVAVFVGLLFSLVASLGWAESRASSALQWGILSDPSGQLTLANVRDAVFTPLPYPKFSRRASSGALWLHVRVPPLDEPRWLWLLLPKTQKVDYFLFSGDQSLRHIATGEMHLYGDAVSAGKANIFTLPADDQARDVFVRLSAYHAQHGWMELLDEQGLIDISQPNYLFGILVGALMALLVYCLIYAVLSRSVGFLWLGAWHACALIVTLAHLGLLETVARALDAPQIGMADVASLLGLLCMLMYARSLLLDRPDRANRLLTYGLPLIAVPALALGVSEFSHWFGTLLYLSLFIVTALLAWLALREHRAGAGWALPLSIGFLLQCLTIAVLTPVMLGYVQIPYALAVASLSAMLALFGLLQCMTLREFQNQRANEQVRVQTADAVNRAELRTKADFLAKISHEIRTPMNGVLGMSELLLGTQLSSKQRDYVQTIHSAGNELLILINEILDISRLESGQIELDDVAFDLGALIEDCLSMFRTRAEQQKIELITFIQPQLPRVIGGDPTRLRQVLVSLLNNAFRQTAEGEILLAVTQDKDQLRLTVQDSGAPLPEAERESLLSSALHSSDLLSASRGSSRLGLIIARQLTHLMQGDFGVQAGEQRGNTLWISLPLDAKTLQQSLSDMDDSLRDARILVVDDNEICRKVLVQQCCAWGMHAVAVASGREALAMLRTRAHLQNDFDLVLLDHDMPGMSGLQLAARIKEDPYLNRDVLLIMLTGLNSAPSKVIARNAGIRRILAKPVAGYTLKATLAEELGRCPAVAHTEPQGSGLPALPSDFRVLVVEDNSISTKVIRGMLRKLNLEPDTVSNGEEALHALREQRYDLVLMDCEMPVMDGFTATRKLREWEAREQRPRTPVVALTAHILGEHKERARLAGMDGHIAKPVELSQLRDLLQHWAGERVQPRRSAELTIH